MVLHNAHFVGQEYNCLIDGGHAKHLSNIKNCMKEYGVMTEHGIQLHGIIVTHPDSDHFNGIKELLDKYGQKILKKCHIVITKAFYRDKKCEGFTKLLDSTYSGNEIEGAEYLSPGLQCHFPTELGCLFRCTPKHENLKVTRTQQLKTFPKPNETSILTIINEYEGKCDVVLTGDSIAKIILPLVEGKEIRIFQVPHHGSSDSSKLEDSQKLKELSQRYDLSAIQDREVKEIFLFYSTFRAQCYLISAGGTDKHNHPHSQVLQGIILANALRRQECVILLTNSCGLILQKLKPLHKLHVPGAENWSKYVKIYHYNDAFITDPKLLQCHTSLCPERCISDVHKGALEWTPEGYINKTRTILSQSDPKMNDSRPQAKDCFKEKSTVEISLQGGRTFSAHVICVPLPHSPRSGDSINYCYVIEESIAPGMQVSQALFLLNDDKKTQVLWRAKDYILFRYINNEWESKALGATVKDITSQISAYDIPYHAINESFQCSGDEDKLVKFLINGCGCKTPCDNDHCICRKNKSSCGPYCRCHDCKNNKVYLASQPSSSNQSNQPSQPSQPNQSSQSHQPKQSSQPNEPRDHLSQPSEPKKPAQLNQPDQPDQKICRCQKGCGNACGCRKRKTHCGPHCKCGDNCTNTKQ